MAQPAKGPRSQITLRVPVEHAEVYNELAQRGGWSSLSDYIACKLAEVHDLPEPPYLNRDRSQGVLELDVVA